MDSHSIALLILGLHTPPVLLLLLLLKAASTAAIRLLHAIMPSSTMV
jgi:hypothetical protein